MGPEGSLPCPQDSSYTRILCFSFTGIPKTVFWCTLCNSKIFTLQKKIFRIMAGAKPRNSCIGLFNRLEISALPCQYIFSLTNSVLNNQEHF
jgi:hypothetical protein